MVAVVEDNTFFSLAAPGPRRWRLRQAMIRLATAEGFKASGAEPQ
jgi:hypothetical protein